VRCIHSVLWLDVVAFHIPRPFFGQCWPLRMQVVLECRMIDRNEFDFDDRVLVDLHCSLSWTSDIVFLPYEIVASVLWDLSLFPHTTPHYHIVLPTGLY